MLCWGACIGRKFKRSAFASLSLLFCLILRYISTIMSVTPWCIQKVLSVERWALKWSPLRAFELRNFLVIQLVSCLFCFSSQCFSFDTILPCQQKVFILFRRIGLEFMCIFTWFSFVAVTVVFVLWLQVFTFGSVPLKTYLPDGDIDLTVFSENQALKDTWSSQVLDMLESEEKNENAEFCVKEVQYIQAEVSAKFFRILSLICLLNS